MTNTSRSTDRCKSTIETERETTSKEVADKDFQDTKIPSDADDEAKGNGSEDVTSATDSGGDESFEAKSGFKFKSEDEEVDVNHSQSHR